MEAGRYEPREVPVLQKIQALKAVKLSNLSFKVRVDYELGKSTHNYVLLKNVAVLEHDRAC